MSLQRDQIRVVLAELVARQDKVLGDPPGLEKLLQSKFQGAHSQEIAAVKAALIEKTPWNLRRNNETVATRRMIQDLGAAVARAHAVNLELACWAIESWALSLRMTIEAAPKPAPAAPVSVATTQTGPTATTQAPKPASATTAAVSTPAAGTPATPVPSGPVQLTPTTRIGLVYGVDDRGGIRVYQTWWNPTPGESASALVSQVKSEPRYSRSLFQSAAPIRAAEEHSDVTRPGQQAPAASKSTTSTASPAAAAVPTTTGRSPSPGAAAAPSAVKPSPSPASAPARPVAAPPVMSPPRPAPAATAAPKPAAPPVAPVKPQTPPAAAPAMPPRIPSSKAEELYDQAMAIINGPKATARSAELIQLLQQSAAQGYVLAETRLGELCLRGRVVKEDLPTAVRWLQSAAQKGEPEAQTTLGSLYQCGIGVPLDLNEAQKWLQRAAKQGSVEAQQLMKQILEA